MPSRTFLVIQWLRIHLLIQGTWVWFLVWEDSIYRRSTRSCTTAIEPTTLESACYSCWVCVPSCPRSTVREAAAVRGPPRLTRRVDLVCRNQRKSAHSSKDAMPPEVNLKNILKNMPAVKYHLTKAQELKHLWADQWDILGSPDIDSAMSKKLIDYVSISDNKKRVIIFKKMTLSCCLIIFSN